MSLLPVWDIVSTCNQKGKKIPRNLLTPTAAPVLTPEDPARSGGVMPDVKGVVAAAVLKVVEALIELGGEDRDVWLERCLVAVLADEAMVVIGTRPLSANRILPTPVSQQSVV